MTTPNQIGITIDCPDASLLASFWESCLGYTRRPATSGGPYVTLERGDGSPDGPPLITFQTVPEPKTGKARIHLDLFVEHAQPLVDEMKEAGASVLSHTEAGDWTTRVLRDPAGTSSASSDPTERTEPSGESVEGYAVDALPEKEAVELRGSCEHDARMRARRRTDSAIPGTPVSSRRPSRTTATPAT